MAVIKNDTKRLNSFFILYDNKSILDNISLLHVANESAEHHPDRKITLSSFTEKDH